ncbi:MAG TPA: lipopolysaccharide assembly protein LapA domain-containing protein [Streptosporangiaceae bacterium]|nr:lipopolysaccharide assembly protein LapA domain-containing protein [Streptosporangiaceae bacterium]
MTQQGEAQQAQQARRRLGGGAIASLIGLAVLVIFVIQNRMRIRIDFLFWSFIWPLWLYTIVIALFGALAWLGLGVMRRHRRRVERRERRRD